MTSLLGGIRKKSSRLEFTKNQQRIDKQFVGFAHAKQMSNEHIISFSHWFRVVYKRISYSNGIPCS